MNEQEINYLREQFSELRKEMNQGFANLRNDIKEVSEKSEAKRDIITDYCRDKRKDIYKMVGENKENINVVNQKFSKKLNDIDKRLIKLFIIGNGIGFVLGATVTAVLSAVFKDLIG